MLTTDGTWQGALLGIARRRRGVSATIVASLAIGMALSLLLLVRRFAGALTEPLPPAALIGTASVVLAWASAVRITSRALARPVAAWLPAIALAAFAIACSYPGSRVVDWLVWPAVFVAYGCVVRIRIRSANTKLTATPQFEPRISLADGGTNEQVVQRLTRARTPDGADVLYGDLVAEFAPGERSVTLHAAFCPPFERLPRVEAEVADDVAANVKVSQVLHNGVGLEIRRLNPAGAKCRTCVTLVASCDAHS